MQSAVLTATPRPGVFSSRASPSPSTPRRPPARTHVVEWICFSVARFSGGGEWRVPKPWTSQSYSSRGPARQVPELSL